MNENDPTHTVIMPEAVSEESTWEPTLSQPRDGATPSLVRKLAEVTATIESVKMTGYNDDRGFVYATESDLLNAVRAPLSSRSVVPLIAEVDRHRWVLNRIDRNGQQISVNVLDLVLQACFWDGESGEVLKYRVTGSRPDYDGTAGSGAKTTAMRELLSKQFLIPLENTDPEHRPPAKPQRSADSSESGFVVKIGKQKGLPLTKQSDSQLKWLLGLSCRDEKYRANHDRDRAAYRVEAQRRGWRAAESGGWAVPATEAEDPAP